MAFVPDKIFTMQDYNDLRLAIADGVKTVKFSDKEVTYRSIDEMKAALAIIAADLDDGTCSPGIGRRTYAISSKGLC